MNRWVTKIMMMLTIAIVINKHIDAKVIVSVFAGREPYMRILHQYLDYMIYSILIDEVHLWDFTTNDDDRAYLNMLLCNRPQYTLFVPEYKKVDLSLNSFRSYYEYYADPAILRKNDVLLKIDDDIVYIDPRHFMQYLRTIHASQTLVFPNIVNNDVCAYIQAANHIHNLTSLMNDLPFPLVLDPHPLALRLDRHKDFTFLKHTCNPATNWFTNGTLALQIHRIFLNDPNKFISEIDGNYIYKGRMSINFFGGTAAVIQKAYHALLWSTAGDDESFLSCNLRHVTGLGNKIVPSVVVSHFAFQMQRRMKSTNDEFEKILIAYHTLANKTIGGFRV